MNSLSDTRLLNLYVYIYAFHGQNHNLPDKTTKLGLDIILKNIKNDNFSIKIEISTQT
jgi:hypothetical protein